MPSYVALLRAVNVGGTGKLPMSELKTMCIAQGFERVQTYIASGNVVFSASQGEAEIKGALEKRLAAYAGKPVGVIVRTAKQLEMVLQSNPFPDALPTGRSPPSWTIHRPRMRSRRSKGAWMRKCASANGKSMSRTARGWDAPSSRFPPRRRAPRATSIRLRSWWNLPPRNDDPSAAC